MHIFNLWFPQCIHNFQNLFQEKVLEMYNMLIGISSEIERIKEEISKRKCNVHLY